MQQFIANAAEKYHYPMEEIETIITAFQEFMRSRVEQPDQEEPLRPDVPGLEQITIPRGITLVYGHPDVGKTAFVCGILASIGPSYTAAYLDTEAKASKVTLSNLNARTLYTKDYVDSGLKDMVTRGLLDVVVVDSITALYASSQHAFLRTISKNVPYVICAAQTRTDISKKKQVPAIVEDAYSMIHAIIRLTEKERINLEGETLYRVYYTVEKSIYHDSGTTNGAFVIYRGVYDAYLTAYDILKNNGIVRSTGGIKYLTADNGSEQCLGKIMKPQQETRNLILTTYARWARRCQ